MRVVSCNESSGLPLNLFQLFNALSSVKGPDRVGVHILRLVVSWCCSISILYEPDRTKKLFCRNALVDGA